MLKYLVAIIIICTQVICLSGQVYSDKLGVQFRQLEACKYLADGTKCDSCFRMTDTTGKLNTCITLDSLRRIFSSAVTVGIVNTPQCSYSIILNGTPQDTFGYYLSQLTDTSFVLHDYDGTACDTISIPFYSLTTNYFDNYFDYYVVNYFDTATFNCDWITECIEAVPLDCDEIKDCIDCDYIETCILTAPLNCDSVQVCVDCEYLESLNCAQLEFHWNCDSTRACITCDFLQALNCPQLETPWNCDSTLNCIDCEYLTSLNCFVESPLNCDSVQNCIDCDYIQGLNCPQLETPWNCDSTLACIDCDFLESLDCFVTAPLNCDSVQNCIDCDYIQGLNCPQLETPWNCDSTLNCIDCDFLESLDCFVQSPLNCDSVQNCIDCDFLQALNCSALEFNCDSVRACETNTFITTGCPYVFTNEDGTTYNFGFNLNLVGDVIQLRNHVNTVCSSITLPGGGDFNCDSVETCVEIEVLDCATSFTINGDLKATIDYDLTFSGCSLILKNGATTCSTIDVTAFRECMPYVTCDTVNECFELLLTGEEHLTGCSYDITLTDEDGNDQTVNIPMPELNLVFQDATTTTFNLLYNGNVCGATICIDAGECGIPLEAMEDIEENSEEIEFLKQKIQKQDKTIEFLIKEIKEMKSRKGAVKFQNELDEIHLNN